MTMMKLHLFILVWVTSLWVASESVFALGMGGSVGADLPLAHRGREDIGIAAEGFYRMDPYEIRFHYSHMTMDQYSLVMGMKYFFSNEVLRPYVEAAAGGVIVQAKGKSNLGYGGKPEATLGVDLGINSYLSAGFAARYFALLYFGSTGSGKFEGQHGFSTVANFIFWF